ncbi:hypothetical protein WMY93_032981 [Mugilogobius chulae]|uniref:Uncharacterized protein n=1 Tax=Mugilogobius chulae TaxID=88201 RepID=A0AAW0MMI2_9GOBI
MLQASNDKLKAKIVDTEGRHRRSNARLVGLPEGIEGTQPSKFFAQLLQDVFGPDIFPSPPELDPERTFDPREQEEGRTEVFGQVVSDYEDYSLEVVSQRKAYKTVMAELIHDGLKPSLLYPACLRITKPDGRRCSALFLRQRKIYEYQFWLLMR